MQVSIKLSAFFYMCIKKETNLSTIDITIPTYVSDEIVNKIFDFLKKKKNRTYLRFLE